MIFIYQLDNKKPRYIVGSAEIKDNEYELFKFGIWNHFYCGHNTLTQGAIRDKEVKEVTDMINDEMNKMDIEVITKSEFKNRYKFYH